MFFFTKIAFHDVVNWKSLKKKKKKKIATTSIMDMDL